MSEQKLPLLVPMTVEALVVNDPVRSGTFMRTEMQYSQVSQFGNASPGLSDNETSFTGNGLVGPHNVPASDYYNGVYLKWRMPEYFTRGHQDNVAGDTKFHPVPNRWLIVRYGGPLSSRAATAWIVESDHGWPMDKPPSPYNISEQASVYVTVDKDGGNLPVSMYMGRSVPLGTWSEPGTSLGLTVRGPGNPAFAFYQPTCNNVFSFVDTLNQEPPQTVSYMVLGWFSDPAADPLHNVTPEDFLSTLEKNKWDLPPSAVLDRFTNCSMLYGTLTGVSWQGATQPAGGAPGGTTSIAVGNTAVQALTALIEIQAEQQGISIDPMLLQAFQLGLINELDRPDGLAVVDEKIRASYFQRYSGGYSWEIVNAPDSTDELSAEEMLREETWLQELNAAESALDAARLALSALQEKLYVLWWKYNIYNDAFQGKTPIPGLQDRTALLQQLDANTQGTVAQQTSAQRDVMLAALKLVPYGNTPEELQKAIDKYAAEHNLPKSRQFKRSSADSYFEPNNPVVLIAGAGTSGIVDKKGKILCRMPNERATGVEVAKGVVVTVATPNLTIPQPDLSGVSGAPWTAEFVKLLVNEFFLLDPANAMMVQAAVPSVPLAQIQAAMADPQKAVGIYPVDAVQTWQSNPWHPLQLLWQVYYYPIEYGTAAAPNWTYSEGTYYWNGSQASVDANEVLAGGIQLTPAASFNLKSRIQQFLDDNPYLPEEDRKAFEALLKFIDDQDGWDLLSQALNGFNDQLQLRTAGTYISPATAAVTSTPNLATLIGDARGFSPAIGNIPKNANYQTLYRPWRAGQFAFVNLVVVDEWGQALWPINRSNYKNINLFLPEDLTPVASTAPLPLLVTAEPVIGAVEPSMLAVGPGDRTLALSGAAFAAGARVMWNATALQTGFVSSTQLTATVPAELVASASTVQITVVSGQQTSPAVPLVVAATPGLMKITPSIVLVGMAQADTFPVTVTGVNFGANATVYLNGKALPTRATAADTLVAQVPSEAISTPGTAAVTVVAFGGTSNALDLTIAPRPTLGSLQPPVIQAGAAAMNIDVYGVGFSPASQLYSGTTPLATIYVDNTHLTGTIPAAMLATPGTLQATEAVGYQVVPNAAESFVQLRPSLLQPARLRFELVSSEQDRVPVQGPMDADPICGWVVPNHLDKALTAYRRDGVALGELFVGVAVDGNRQVCWQAAPYSPYATLQAIADDIPHFGPFLLELKKQSPETFLAFQRAIDETLWSTAPADSAFDDHLSVLIGRPLAMLRTRLQFQFEGPIDDDPSWQYTFQSGTPQVAGYKFAVQLGDIANVEDGLIGYFTADDYSRFNVLRESGAKRSQYLHPIGVDNNYLYLPADNQTPQYISMLVDPRAAVHARTSILPDVQVAAPAETVSASLSGMNVSFRTDGILTDQQTTAATEDQPAFTSMLMPVPKVTTGTWSWVEAGETGPVPYPVLPNNTTATLTAVAPVLRRGMLQLSGAFANSSGERARKAARDARKKLRG